MCRYYDSCGSDVGGRECEGVERRLVNPAPGLETGLPVAETVLVADEEPEEHRDSRVLPRDRHGLRQVLRLQPRRDAEVPVRWIGLVAVLVEPQRLVAVETGELLGEHVEVAEGDRRRARRCRGRRLARAAGIRVMRIRVEAARAGALHRTQKG